MEHNMFRNLGIIGLLLAVLGMASCGVMRKVEETAAKTSEVLTKINAKMEQIDTNKDGKWSIDEILLFLGVPAGGLALLFRNFISDRRKAKIEARIENLGTDRSSD